MKNLKKALALVLIAVMAFSLVTIASAKTNFSDDKDINYATAVGVMTGIGAINGYVDGSFQPKGLVTRAEAAKMVAYAVLGPTVAAALKTTTTSFSDVPASHWAAAYIEWAVSQGILNGLGDGSFNPDGNVTSFELAKMMLCAAGYGKNSEYIGTNWNLNVAKDAMLLGVFTGNESANFAVPATREECALYVFNGINRVKQVDYNELFGYYGKGTSVTSGDKGATIAQEVYKMKNDLGIVTGNVLNGAARTGTNVNVAAFDDATGKVKNIAATATPYNFSSTLADIGQMVSVYSNTVTGKVYFSETVSKTVYAIFGAATPNGYNNTFGSLTYAPATQVYTFAANYKTPTLSVGNPVGSAAAVVGVDLMGSPSTLTVGSVAPAGTYATYAGQIVSYMPAPVKSFHVVTAIDKTLGSETITFDGLTLKNSVAKDEIQEYSGIAVGDYVTLTEAGSTYIAEKCTTVTGKISTIDYVGGFKSAITLDGKSYPMSHVTNTDTFADLGQPQWPVSKTDFNGNVYTLYLDSYGNVITSVLKSGTSASAVVYVTGDSWTANADYGSVEKVQAVNSAGEQVTYNLGSTHHTGSGFYTVTVDSDGIATLVAPDLNPSDANKLSDNVVKSASVTIAKTDLVNAATNGGDNRFFYASDVTFVFVSGSGATLKITKVTGLANAVGVDLTDDAMLYFGKTESTNKTVTTVVVPGEFTGASNAKVMYVDAYAAIAGTDSTGTQYNVYLDGALTKLTFTGTIADQYKGTFVTYKVNADGIYTITGVNSNRTGEDTISSKDAIFGNYITVDGNTYKADIAKVVDLAQPIGDPAIYTSLAAMQAAAKNLTVDYAVNSDNVVTAIYVTLAQ